MGNKTIHIEGKSDERESWSDEVLKSIWLIINKIKFYLFKYYFISGRNDEIDAWTKGEFSLGDIERSVLPLGYDKDIFRKLLKKWRGGFEQFRASGYSS